MLYLFITKIRYPIRGSRESNIVRNTFVDRVKSYFMQKYLVSEILELETARKKATNITQCS